jgi:hypothetical protein
MKMFDHDCLFLANGEGGLVVCDATDPFDVTLIDRAETKSFAQGVVVENDHAYIADLTNLQVVSVDSASLFNEIEEDLSLHGHFVARTPSTYERLQIHDNHAFIAAGNGGLEIVDITDPDNLALTGKIRMNGYCSDVHIHGNTHVLLAAGSSGIQVVDIGDVENPENVATYGSGDFAMGLDADGERIYLANYYGGFQVIDFADPEAPEQEAVYDTYGAVFDAKYCSIGENAYIYAIDSESKLHVVDCNDPGMPVLVHSVEVPEPPQSLLVEGDYLYIASGYSGLSVFSISNPANPEFKASIYITGFALDLSKFGDMIYLALGEMGIEVIDVSDPENPVFAEEYNTSGFAWSSMRDPEVRDNEKYLYVASDTEGIIVLNSTKEDSLYFEETASTEATSLTMAITSDSLYVAELSQCRTMSLDPETFMEEGTVWDRETLISDTKGDVEVPDLIDLSLNLPHMYLANGYEGILIIDTTMPKTSRDAYSRYITPGYTHSVDLYGNLAILSDNFSIMIIDPPFTGIYLSSFRGEPCDEGVRLTWRASGNAHPAGPQLQILRSAAGKDERIVLGTAALEEEVFIDAAALNPGTYNYWLHLKETDSLYGPAAVFVHSPAKERISLDQNDPNPFNPFTTIRFAIDDVEGTQTAAVALDIYNVKGELVKRLVKGNEFTAGTYAVNWNGKNDAGIPVPSGIYYYRLKVNDYSVSRKMVLLK